VDTTQREFRITHARLLRTT